MSTSVSLKHVQSLPVCMQARTVLERVIKEMNNLVQEWLFTLLKRISRVNN